MTIKFTVDCLGFVPRLWKIWRCRYGVLRCIGLDKGVGRTTITAEVRPNAWKTKGETNE